MNIDGADVILGFFILLLFAFFGFGLCLQHEEDMQKLKIQEIQVQAGVKLCRTSTAP